MDVNYDRLLRELELDLMQEAEADREFEEELGPVPAPPQYSGPLRSLRFADDTDLQAVALGHLRLGRANDSPYPAPILSGGRAVRKVQQALIDLGYSLPQFGDDSRYGEETYQAVLAYKRQFNILTVSGYLDGIVGTKTIAHLDSNFPPGPLPACGMPDAPVIAAEGKYEDASEAFGVPWVTCDPRLAPTGGFCSKTLPDRGERTGNGGFGVILPSISQFYCFTKPNIHLEFTATWEEVLPPDQRPPDQQNRALDTPKYDVQLGSYIEGSLTPGQTYIRDPKVPATIGQLLFTTVGQRNRIFRVRYSISES